MFFLRSRQVRAASSAARSQAVTKRAVDAELILARLGRLGITCEGIAVIGGADRRD
jgi:hypothetical protein